MVKALMHLFRTYFVTFRYLKKKELDFAWMLVLVSILWFIFSHIII